MIDEMYFQKSAHYQSGEYVEEEGNLYKRIFAFVVVGLKQSLPFVVQTIPEVTFKGQWLTNDLQPTMKRTLSQLLLKNFPYFFIFSLGIHLNGCFRTSAFTCLFNKKEKRVNENKQLVS